MLLWFSIIDDIITIFRIECYIWFDRHILICLKTIFSTNQSIMFTSHPKSTTYYACKTCSMVVISRCAWEIPGWEAGVFQPGSTGSKQGWQVCDLSTATTCLVARVTGPTDNKPSTRQHWKCIWIILHEKVPFIILTLTRYSYNELFMLLIYCYGTTHLCEFV